MKRFEAQCIHVIMHKFIKFWRKKLSQYSGATALLAAFAHTNVSNEVTKWILR